MYGLLMAVLLLFPWSLVVLIAFRALRASRRSAIRRKHVEQFTNGRDACRTSSLSPPRPGRVA
jgi:hypothetical protein